VVSTRLFSFLRRLATSAQMHGSVIAAGIRARAATGVVWVPGSLPEPFPP